MMQQITIRSTARALGLWSMHPSESTSVNGTDVAAAAADDDDVVVAAAVSDACVPVLVPAPTIVNSIMVDVNWLLCFRPMPEHRAYSLFECSLPAREIPRQKRETRMMSSDTVKISKKLGEG